MTEVVERKFARDDGVVVHVRIENSRGMIAAAVESALINHAHLYPVDRTGLGDLGKDQPYWVSMLLGIACTAISFGLVFGSMLMAGLTVQQIWIDEPARTVFQVFPLFITPFAIGIFVLMEWKSRRFRRKSARIAQAVA